MNRRMTREEWLKRQQFMAWMARQEEEAREASNDTLRDIDSMIKDCYAYYANKDPNTAIICIPGRANDGAMFAKKYYEHTGFKNAVFVGPTPNGFAWYPMPHDAVNQSRAVNGLPRAITAIENVQQAVEKKYGIKKENTILTGFSAGGVMAIQTAAYSDEPYQAVVCHSGAILEPKDLPVSKNYQSVLLTHNRDDYCFNWIERYIPMRNALTEKGYDVYSVEKNKGGHVTSEEDIQQSAEFLIDMAGLNEERVAERCLYETAGFITGP